MSRLIPTGAGVNKKAGRLARPAKPGLHRVGGDWSPRRQAWEGETALEETDWRAGIDLSSVSTRDVRIGAEYAIGCFL